MNVIYKKTLKGGKKDKLAREIGAQNMAVCSLHFLFASFISQTGYLRSLEHGTATLEEVLAVSYKTIHMPTLWHINSNLPYLCKGNPIILSQGTYSVHSSFIHNNQKLETAPTCPLIEEWTNCDLLIEWNITHQLKCIHSQYLQLYR